MVLHQLAILLLIPPVNLAVLASLCWFWRRHRIARAVSGLSLAGLLVLALPMVAQHLLLSLERGLPHAPQAVLGQRGAGVGAPQAIVVLGADIAFGMSPSGGATAAPGALSLERLQAAAALARRTGLPLLISGGSVDADKVPVAMVMAASLRADFAVAPRWIEPDSLDTWQNAQDSAVILRAAGIQRVLLVTHAWHMRRALLAFAATGIAADPVPVRWDRKQRWQASSFLPHATAWLVSYYACHEWIGCLWYWLRLRIDHSPGRSARGAGPGD
jgi:uncharacterized SAM-binding protein YcdF (DUF218 family)